MRTPSEDSWVNWLVRGMSGGNTTSILQLASMGKSTVNLIWPTEGSPTVVMVSTREIDMDEKVVQSVTMILRVIAAVTVESISPVPLSMVTRVKPVRGTPE